MGWCLAVAGAAGFQGSSHCGKFQQQLPPVSVLLELGEPLTSRSGGQLCGDMGKLGLHLPPLQFWAVLRFA